MGNVKEIVYKYRMLTDHMIPCDILLEWSPYVRRDFKVCQQLLFFEKIFTKICF